MLMLDGPIIAAALVAGAWVGGHCAAFSGRENQRLAYADRDRARAAEALARQKADTLVNEAHDAMGVLAQRLVDEMRARRAAELRAAVAEDHLRTLRAEAAAQELADEIGHVLEPAQ